MAIEAEKAEPGLDSEVAPQMERQVGVGVTWKLVGQVGVQSIRLITVAVLARLLTPEDYGAAAIAIALATFAPTVADMGVGSALVQTEQAPRLVRSTAFWSSIGFGLALFVLFAAAAGPIENFMGDSHVGTMVAAGGLTFAIYAIGATSQAVFMREMRFRDIELRNWLSLIVGAVVGIGAALAGAGAWALVAQQLALMATFAGALWWGAGWRPAFEFSGVAFRSLVSFALRIVGGRWARLIELLVLTLMIGHYVGVTELGAWTFAMSMVILPLTLIAIPIAEVLFSAFSRLRNEPERIAALWLRSIAYLAAVLLPLLLGLMVVSPDLVPIVFGLRWEVSVGILQILSIVVIIRGLQSWGSVYLDAIGRPEVTMWTQLASLCLTPFAVLIGYRWGIEGIAACFVICQLIAVEIPMFIIVLREMGVAPRVLAARVSGVFGAALVMAGACLVGRQALEALGFGMGARAALTIGLGIVVYGLALRLLAPEITRTAADLCRSRIRKLLDARRRRSALPA